MVTLHVYSVKFELIAYHSYGASSAVIFAIQVDRA